VAGAFAGFLRTNGKGLDSHAEQKYAVQSRVEQSRAWANCALFASCRCEAFETEYNIRDG